MGTPITGANVTYLIAGGSSGTLTSQGEVDGTYASNLTGAQGLAQGANITISVVYGGTTYSASAQMPSSTITVTTFQNNVQTTNWSYSSPGIISWSATASPPTGFVWWAYVADGSSNQYLNSAPATSPLNVPAVTASYFATLTGPFTAEVGMWSLSSPVTFSGAASGSGMYVWLGTVVALTIGP